MLEMDDENDEYAKLIRRMNPPRVVIDNDACEQATVIQVGAINRNGTLLEVVQVLTDLNLVITKAYMSSDGGWFMDVFHVTDHAGKKIKDEETISYIHKVLEADAFCFSTEKSSNGVLPSKEHTSIELTGSDRPGLLSEVSAVLTDLMCNVVSPEIWTRNGRAAAIIHITDQSTGYAIEDPNRLSLIKKLLCNILKGNGNFRTPRMCISSPAEGHTGRRLHQMMFADRDFERLKAQDDVSLRPYVTVSNYVDRDYTVVTMRTMDRPKLLFDTICALTDMQYVVFHGAVITGTTEAYQEYYVRHVDGLPISSKAERQRVTECLEAAIKRRTSEVKNTKTLSHSFILNKSSYHISFAILKGLELELCTDDRIGLLSDITRIIRENGLCIRRAEISTKNGKATDTFVVTDVSGIPVETKTVHLIQRQIGQTILQVRGNFSTASKFPPEAARSFFFGNFLKGRTFQVNSCS